MLRGLAIAHLVILGSAVSINRFDDTSEIVLRIKESRDTSANPCENFYQFVCGNSNISTLAEKVAIDEEPAYKRVEDLIIKGTSSKDFRPFQLIDDVYEICMSDEAIGEQIVEGLPNLFDRIGGWPLLEGLQWNTIDYMLEDFVLHSKFMGLTVNPFFSFNPVEYPGRDSTIKFVIATDPPEFSKSITYPSDPLLNAYAKYVEETCQLVGSRKIDSKEIKDIVDLELKMSSFCVYLIAVFNKFYAAIRSSSS